ncbi:MAG: MlaD family protein [Verrucomicrobiota bacterium]
MKTKVSPAVVGLFVLGALLLGVIALLSFGGVNFFNKPERFAVYFDESVHGLDLGSPVKFRGVRVGRVVSVGLRYLPERRRSLVEVQCELTRDVLTGADGAPIDVSDRAELQALVDQGMSAQLGVIGLATGLLFVELDFRPGTEVDGLSAAVASDHVVVPAAPSSLSQFQANLTTILDKINGIDFVGLSEELKGLLVDARAQLAAADVGALIAAWTSTADNLNQVVASPELQDTLKQVNAASKNLNQLLAKLDASAGPTTEQLNATLAQTRETMAAFTQTADTLRKFVGAQQNLGADAADALTKLGRAAEAVAQLADFLERNPNALLTGRKGSE